MGKTSIEWTDASWNPVVGCTEVSPGCANCYAAKLAATRLKNHPDYKGLAIFNRDRFELREDVGLNHPRWTGQVRFLPERLEDPLHWRKPRRIFVCDMGDLFHESVTHEQIRHVFKTIALGGGMGHTFQILTKRAKRLRDFMLADHGVEYVRPMPWLWLGVSVENQHFADDRIPLLLETPAAVRFISAEPLLGPIFLKNYGVSPWGPFWVICGGESGPNARPMSSDWARDLRDQCRAASVPFFFKQWGEWKPLDQMDHAEHCAVTKSRTKFCMIDFKHVSHFKVGKQAAGRLLDGRTWDEFPK